MIDVVIEVVRMLNISRQNNIGLYILSNDIICDDSIKSMLFFLFLLRYAMR